MPPRHVLFLPGFMCDERLFAPQLARLQMEGFRVSVADLSGADSVEALAASVLRSAPDRFALAGLSMGGIVAFEVLRQDARRVTHLALLDSTARAETRSERRAAQLRRVAEGDLRAVVAEELLPQYFSLARRTPELVALVVDMAGSLGPEVFARQTQSLMGRPSCADLLGRVGCPALVLAGSDDTLCPPEVQREIARGIAGARLSLIPGCGHLSTLERPDEVSEALLGLLGNANRTRPWAPGQHRRSPIDAASGIPVKCSAVQAQ